MREVNCEDNIMPIGSLVGRVFRRVWADDYTVYMESGDGGPDAQLAHIQSCCEDVRIEEADGEWEWLAGFPIVAAEARETDRADTACGDRTETWTFYAISSVRGTCHIRFHGSSNGYYSERVDLFFLSTEDDT